jgi:hypothetical protein
MDRRRGLLALLSAAPAPVAAALALGACASAPEAPRLTVPAITTEIRQFAGSALRGPVAGEMASSVPADPNEVVYARIRLATLERLPQDQLSAISSRARLIADAARTVPILPYATVAMRARVGVGEPASEFLRSAGMGTFGQIRWLGELTGGLIPGITSAFVTHPNVSPSADPSRRSSEEMRVDIWRGHGDTKNRLSVVFSIDVWRREAPAPISPLFDEIPEFYPWGSPPKELRLVRETIALDDAPEVDGAPLLLVFRSPFAEKGTPAILIALDVSTTPGGARESLAAGRHAIERSERDLAESVADAAARIKPADAREYLVSQIGRALASLESVEGSRSPLIFVSNASRAELASDFALVSSDELLREYLGKIAEKINARVGKVPRTPEQVGDMLEVTAYQILANKLTNDELTSEMRGVLIRHAGEVAISPIEIEDMVAECNTVDSIRERLVALNQFYLGHADATARVRAFDWLRIRGLVPIGYDPLAPAKERRKALDAFAQSQPNGDAAKGNR